MVIDHVIRQRMNKNVEALAVEHQPRHDTLVRLSPENDVELRDRVWTSRLIGEGARFDGEPTDDRVSQALGDRSGGGVEIDMGVIANGYGHLGILLIVL